MLLHNQYEFNPATDLIGSGGFARVYKAFDINLHRTVALKRFDKKDTKYSVLNEIRRCFDFNHPNIIRYLNCFQVENTNIFGDNEIVEFGVMEYADCGDFSQLIDKKTKVSPEELESIVTGILDGLQYLHTPNPMHQKPAIIHRDLKASNILFTRIDGRLIPKICDFGISKEMGGSGTTTATGTGYLGTIEYMAPEQINLAKFSANGQLQPNTDLWALGCMLYEYFTGKAPFGKRADGDLPIDIQSNILDKEPDYPNSIPAPYKELIQKCLVKNASKRVDNANTLKDILLGVTTPAPTIEKTPISGDTESGSTIGSTRIKPQNQPKTILTILVFIKITLILISTILLIISIVDSFSPKDDTGYIAEGVTIEAAPEDTQKDFQFTNTHGESYHYSGGSTYTANENGKYADIPNGKGTATYTNGDKYDGDFVNGLREGFGTYYWADGEKFLGQFKNNKRNGFGKYFDAQGNLIEQGVYVDGNLK